MPGESSKLRVAVTSATPGGSAVVECSGRLTLETTDLLKSHVKGMIPQHRQIVLDFTELVHIDSAGIGTLVGLYISAKKESCELYPVNYGPAVRQLLGMTHLLDVFEVCGRTGARPM